MVGPGSNRFFGSGSRRQTPTNDENRVLTEEEIQNQVMNAHLGDDVPTLDPYGVWFDDNRVKKAVRVAIKGKFDKFVPSYSEASQEQKDAWWHLFKGQFKYRRFREAEIKAAFEEYCMNRLRDIVFRAGTRDDSWMSEDVKKEMKAYRESEKFQNRSAKSKANRKSKGQDGKAPGTHTMGRQNTIQLMDKMCEGGLSQPPPLELVKKSKTKKLGGYVTSKISQVIGTFTKKKEVLLETVPEEDIDDSELYYESVEGFDKKGRLWGLGKAASYYYDKPRHSTSGVTKTPYTPGLVGRLSADNRAIREQLSGFQEWRAQMEETLASQGINIPTQSCNPNNLNFQNNNRRDDNDDNDGGNDQFGSAFVNEIFAS